MTAAGDYAERGAGCAAGGSADPSHFRSAGTLIHPKLLFVWPPNCRRTGWMVGPTATESLIKAAAAGEGAREGGGAGGKGGKEVGGNTGPRPPQLSRSARHRRARLAGGAGPAAAGRPGGAGWGWAPAASCLLEKREQLGVPGSKSTRGPTTLSRTLGLGRWRRLLGSSPAPASTPPLLTCRSPSAGSHIPAEH